MGDREAPLHRQLAAAQGQACEEGRAALRPSSAAEAAGVGPMPGYKLKQLHNCSNLCSIASGPGAFLSAGAQPAVTASWFQLLLLALTAFAGG